LLSVLGCLAGLIATAKARTISERRQRARWLLLAAWAIGGTGIWVMHFMAMIGFTAAAVTIRYDIPVTIASWITAVVVVAIGLFMVGFGRPNAFKIIGAGALTGVGVAGMHYTGMAAMRMPAMVGYDAKLVAASVAIAVVAATVALWFTVTIRRGFAIVIAALIMGVAVEGMHYTGMYAMRVSDVLTPKPVEGLLPAYFLGPIVVFVVLVIVVLLASLLSRDDDDRGDPTIPIYEPPPDGGSGPTLTSGRQRTAASAFIRPPRGASSGG
jgi:NO-binding membrane sensor protein with MHYT domain